MHSFGAHFFRLVYSIFTPKSSTHTHEATQSAPLPKNSAFPLPQRRPCRHEVTRMRRTRPISPLCHCSTKYSPSCTCKYVDEFGYVKAATRRLSDPAVLQPSESPYAPSPSYHRVGLYEEDEDMDMDWIEEWLLGRHPSSPFSTDSESGSDTEFSSSSSSTRIGGATIEDLEDDDLFTITCPVQQIPAPPCTPFRDKPRYGRPLGPVGIHKSKRLRGVRVLHHERSISPTPLPQLSTADTPYGLY